jgi:peptidoglycan/xylan/chitin deacetylase (PgdA/CDA1 family)
MGSDEKSSRFGARRAARASPGRRLHQFNAHECRGGAEVNQFADQGGKRMNARAILKSTAPVIAHYSGIAKALAFRYGGPGVIFMLHSTTGDSAPSLEDLRCPVAALERALRWLEASGVDFVSLDEAVRRLAEPPRGRFCAFTFDDGFADNLTHALPVMERFGAPFTVYVATGMITGEIDAWWLGLAALIRGAERIDLPDLDRRFDCADHRSKRQAYAAVETLIHSDYDTLNAVRAAVALAGIDCGALARREALTVKQLRQLASHPLVTIGAHTERHTNLARASEDEVRREMIAGRQFLESILQREIAHFAYPFGNARACGPREARIARAAGFRTAVTTRRGTLFPEHIDNLFALPREPIVGRDTPATLQCKLGGMNRALQSRFGNPVACM